MTTDPPRAEGDVDYHYLERLARSGPRSVALDRDVILLLAHRLRAADQRAAELAAQNAALLAAVEGARAHIVEHSDPRADALYGDRNHEPEVLRSIDTALRTTPAEALEVVRRAITAAQTPFDCAGVTHPDWLAAARRLFGPAARGEAG